MKMDMFFVYPMMDIVNGESSLFRIVDNDLKETLVIYLIIKNNTENLEENIIQELNEKYFKIKDCLIRCGNIVLECSRDETKNILFSFFNLKKFLDKY